MATTAYTYDDGAMREDLLDIITNISPTETQLLSGLGVTSATNILHEWSTDTLDTAGENAQVEGADATYGALTNPTRLTNHTQIISKPYRVSGSVRAIDAAGYEDRLSYEAMKAMKNWKNDVEFALMRGSLACGSGSAARRLKGVKRFMTNNNHTSQSGVSLTERMFNDYLQNVWDDGVEVDAVYAAMYLKRKISGFTAGNTKNIKAEDKRLVNSVDVYEADAAKLVKLFAHRYVTVSGDVNYDLVGLNEDLWKVSYLRKPITEPLAKTGDADKEQVIGELTLECRHKDAGFWTEKLK